MLALELDEEHSGVFTCGDDVDSRMWSEDREAIGAPKEVMEVCAAVEIPYWDNVVFGFIELSKNCLGGRYMAQNTLLRWTRKFSSSHVLVSDKRHILNHRLSEAERDNERESLMERESGTVDTTCGRVFEDILDDRVCTAKEICIDGSAVPGNGRVT